MLIIEKTTTYRDGGTVGIECRMVIPWTKVEWLEGTENRTIQLCVDRRFGQEPAIWFGYPGSEGSERIEDETIIDYIIKKVAQHKERQAYKLDQFIEIRENIRNFRIDKTLNQ
jgi:hypothetical protein